MSDTTYTVYALVSDRGKIYIGQTADIKQRLERHNNRLANKKSSFSHKNGSFWTVIYTEECSTRSEAIKRERQLKSYQGRQFIHSKIPKTFTGA